MFSAPQNHCNAVTATARFSGWGEQICLPLVFQHWNVLIHQTQTIYCLLSGTAIFLLLAWGRDSTCDIGRVEKEPQLNSPHKRQKFRAQVSHTGVTLWSDTFRGYQIFRYLRASDKKPYHLLPAHVGPSWWQSPSPPHRCGWWLWQPLPAPGHALPAAVQCAAASPSAPPGELWCQRFSGHIEKRSLSAGKRVKRDGVKLCPFQSRIVEVPC